MNKTKAKMSKTKVQISDEVTGNLFTLMLTPEEINRARSDNMFLKQLVQSHYDEEARRILMAFNDQEEAEQNIAEAGSSTYYEQDDTNLFVGGQEVAQNSEPNDLEEVAPNNASGSRSESDVTNLFGGQEDSQNSELNDLQEVASNNAGGSTSEPDFEEKENQSLFIWSNECIFLLLSLYEENKEDFLVKRHKKVYDEIAKKMKNVNKKYEINGSQCQSKMAGLKKIYKKIKDLNNTSGNGRATWPYYDRMQELFGNKRSIEPLALASESGPAASAMPAVPEVIQKKRKIESLFEDFFEERKKSQEQKQEMLQKILDQKEKQHKEKMMFLKELCRNLQK